jgi:hypothetical protein
VSQQLRLMELSGLVEKTRVKGKNLSMPRVQYSLKAPLHFVVSCHMGASYKQVYEESDCLRSLVFALFGVKRKGVFEVLLKYFMDNYDTFKDAKCVAISHTTQQHIDILVITEKHLEKLRGDIANQTVKACGHSMRIALWSHTEEEFRKGVANKEEYFLNFLKNKLIYLIKEKDIIGNPQEVSHE